MLLEKNVSYTLLVVLVFCIAAFFWKDFTFGSPPGDQVSFRITTEYYGANAHEIERIITIPLENSLSDIPGIIRIQSSSEFAKSRITINADENIDPDILFTDIRERVDRTKGGFPKAVQKPRIVSSDATNNPVFIVSFHSGLLGIPEFGEFVDREIKTRYQRIPGTGEIEIGGRGVLETVIILDDEKSAQYAMDTLSLSDLLNRLIVRTPVGDFSSHSTDTPVLFDSNFNSLDGFRTIEIPAAEGTTIKLSEIATVFQRHRKPDQISRINGEQRIILYVYSGGNANPLILCRNLKHVTNMLKDEGYTPEIVYSKGEEIEQGIKKILFSMLLSMAAIFLFIGLFIPGIATRIIFAVSIPASLFLGAAFLSALQIPIDPGIISGLIIGSGLIIDNYLVVYNHLELNRNQSLSYLASPLFSSTATTVIVFLPLILGKSFDTQITSIATAVSILLVISLFISFTFMKKPCLIALSVTRKQTPLIPLSAIARPFYKLKDMAIRKKYTTVTIYGVVVLSAIIILVFTEKEFSPAENPGILFTHVEFPSGTTIGEIDNQLTPYVSHFMSINEVKLIESSARRGSAQINITFDPEVISASSLAKKLEPLTKNSSKGQFFIGMNQNLDTYRIAITITGPDHATLRETVFRVGKEFSDLSWVKGVVYHFKEEPPSFVFSPNLNRLSTYGVYPDKFAQILRWNIQQPVSIKWMYNQKEQDVRISGSGGLAGLFGIDAIPVISSQKSTLRIKDAGTLSHREDPDKLYRENRQNSISFSITTDRMGLQTVHRNLQSALTGTELPKGYGIFMDSSVGKSIDNYRQMILVLCIAIFLIYALLAIQSESFTKPLLVISVIPFCSFFPLVIISSTGMPITASILVALTVLSGMSVNNYILIIDAMEKESRTLPVYDKITNAIKNRFMPLFLSSGTSILAALPILFSASPFSSTPSTLAIIVSLGLLGSFIGSFVFLPSLLVIYNGSSKNVSNTLAI